MLLARPPFGQTWITGARRSAYSARVPCRRTPSFGLLLAVFVASALALSSCGGTDGASSASASSATGRDAAIDPLPTRNPRAKAVEPVAGESGDVRRPWPAADPADQPATERRLGAAAQAAATSGTGPTSDAAISNADVLKNGIALPPIEAPEEVPPDHRGRQPDRAHALPVGRRARQVARPRL